MQSAFLELTTAYECDFFEDMARLNVLPPDAVTRVTDYVPEIIAYIEQIMDNGFCYEGEPRGGAPASSPRRLPARAPARV